MAFLGGQFPGLAQRRLGAGRGRAKRAACISIAGSSATGYREERKASPKLREAEGERSWFTEICTPCAPVSSVGTASGGWGSATETSSCPLITDRLVQVQK